MEEERIETEEELIKRAKKREQEAYAEELAIENEMERRRNDEDNSRRS